VGNCIPFNALKRCPSRRKTPQSRKGFRTIRTFSKNAVTGREATERIAVPSKEYPLLVTEDESRVLAEIDQYRPDRRLAEKMA
jgi:hypothetical protein